MKTSTKSSSSNDFELPTNEDTPKQSVNIPEPETKPEAKPEPKFSKEELMRVFDEMIFTGVYSEKISIRGKLQITMRTREAEEIEAITMNLDSSGASLVSTLNEKRSLLNLHYALTAYQGKNLGVMKPTERSSFINKLPAPIISVLIREMVKFDEKVYAACDEGEENF